MAWAYISMASKTEATSKGKSSVVSKHQYSLEFHGKKYKGIEGWALDKIMSFIGDPYISFNAEGAVPLLYIHGEDVAKEINEDEYNALVKMLDVYLSEECEKQYETDTLWSDEVYNVSLYSCPIGKVGVVKVTDARDRNNVKDVIAYVGEKAWRHAKDYVIDTIEDYAYFSGIPRRVVERYKKEIEELPD
jgi:hypothetical protein